MMLRLCQMPCAARLGRRSAGSSHDELRFEYDLFSRLFRFSNAIQQQFRGGPADFQRGLRNSGQRRS